MRWGLVPFWAKDIKVGFANINAKAQGIEGKPAFREAFQRRRGLVPVDNFYEWTKDRGREAALCDRACGQTLVEGLRVLFPELYTFVRDHGPTFVVEDAPFGPTRVRSLTRAFGGVALDALRLKDIAAKVMEDADEAQQNAGSNLLRALFGDPGRPRSVALARYFDRYFSYTVDPEDISDAELAEFRELCEGGEDEKSTDFLTSSPPALGRPTPDETFGVVARRVSYCECRQRGRFFYGAEEPVF